MAIINTKSDLEALAGTPAHDEFMAFLAGTLYRLERDDEAQEWRCIEDDTTIARFGFTRADFPAAQPPAVPEWVAPPVVVPRTISRFQARAALLGAGLLATIESAMADPGMDPFAKLAWDYAQDFNRDSPTIAGLQSLLGLTDAVLDELFRAGALIEA